MTSEANDARDTLRRLTARISGEVQGVGYRYFARRRAQALGLRGYAMNLADGSVEVVAEGSPALLAQLLEQLRRGPISARVSDTQADWSDSTNEFREFSVR